MNNFFGLIKQKKTVILILLAAAAGLGVLAFFTFRFFTPFGATVSYQFNSMFDGDKLSKIKGAEETSSFNPTKTGVLQIPQQTVRQNAVTFNLKLITKPIEGVWVNLKFKGNPKEVKIGVRGSEKEKYQYLPLYNQILNSLFWDQTTSGGTTFWQREKKYQDIAGLVSKPPISDEIKTASYFFDQSEMAIKENDSSSQSNLIIEKTLRGTHTLMIRVEKMPFILNIEKQDDNAYVGTDELLIQVFKNNKKIVEKKITDDGVTEINGLRMAPQSEKINIDNLPFGVYKVVLSDLSNGADVRIKKIKTNQSALVFASHLFLYDYQPTNLWTNSMVINMPIVNKDNIQIAKLDDETNLDISKPGRVYEFDLRSLETKKNQEVHKISLEKNPLIIDGDGYFSFSKDSFFNPEPIKTVDLSTVSDISKIDYIIADYQPVKKDGEWYTAQAYFDPKDIVIDGDKLYFSLESPGLSGYSGEIVIDSLEVTVKKPGWFSSAVGQKGETVDAPQAKKINANIFSQVSNWTKEKLTAVGKVIVETFNSVWNWVRGVFGQTPAPTPAPSAKITPKSSPTPPSASTAVVFTSLVRVLNGGAEKGAAASVSAILKSNGFANVEADNADNQDYKGVAINYRKDDIKIAEKIELLLKNAYGTVTKTVAATSAAETVVILGKK